LAHTPTRKHFALAASEDFTAIVWDFNGQPITPPLKHGFQVWYIAFSPDGRLVVTASIDNTARVWDASTGQALTPSLQHNKGVLYASFTPDGRRIVTATADDRGWVWDLPIERRPLDDLALLGQLLAVQPA